jgi:hypothetical protein
VGAQAINFLQGFVSGALLIFAFLQGFVSGALLIFAAQS